MNKNNLVKIEVKMLTNYERIKNMSIEEMAEFINRLKMNFCEDSFIAGGCNGCTIEGLCDLPKSKTMQYLEDEVKNDK